MSAPPLVSANSTEAPEASATSAAISVEGLRHSYGERAALKGVNFGVNSAELFGLLGPNGSGKTTMFRILSTLMVPSGGRALILSFDPARQAREVRQHIGIVFQASSVDVKLSVAENLKHAGHLYGLRGAELRSRIAEMMQRVGLADRAGDRVETLSGGMQRRVELAKGLLHRPEVLLLDEPTTGLDPGARRDLWMYLKQLRDEQGVTVLVTTHLMEEAERCDRVAILSHGTLVGLGTPSELKAQIGGDVIQLESDNASSLASRIEQRFGAQVTVFDDQLRIERQNGHRFIPELMEAFPGEIRSISVSRPSLEDVFIQRTGHRFWTESEEADARNKQEKKHG